jgi:hypothetical protein
MIGEFLIRVTTALEMHGVPYMLTGSVASSLYGVPRATTMWMSSSPRLASSSCLSFRCFSGSGSPSGAKMR